jgi:hypothetical protein
VVVVQRQRKHYVEISEQRRGLNRYGCGRGVARTCETNHHSVHSEGYFWFGQNGTVLQHATEEDYDIRCNVMPRGERVQKHSDGHVMLQCWWKGYKDRLTIRLCCKADGRGIKTEWQSSYVAMLMAEVWRHNESQVMLQCWWQRYEEILTVK